MSCSSVVHPLKFGMQWDSSATKAPVKYQGDDKTLNNNIAHSKHYMS